jgi:hypothetical protein
MAPNPLPRVVQGTPPNLRYPHTPPRNIVIQSLGADTVTPASRRERLANDPRPHRHGQDRARHRRQAARASPRRPGGARSRRELILSPSSSRPTAGGTATQALALTTVARISQLGMSAPREESPTRDTTAALGRIGASRSVPRRLPLRTRWERRRRAHADLRSARAMWERAPNQCWGADLLHSEHTTPRLGDGRLDGRVQECAAGTRRDRRSARSWSSVAAGALLPSFRTRSHAGAHRRRRTPAARYHGVQSH